MNRLLPAALALLLFVGVSFRPCEGPRVAVVQMSTLVSKNRTSQAEQALLQQWIDASQKLLEKIDKDMKDTMAARDQLKPDSDDYRAKTTDLKQLKANFDVRAASLKEERDARIGRMLADAHARITAACKSYLEGHDLDLILQYESTPVHGTTGDQAFQEIVVRSVVAYRATLDVTEGVLAILDAK